MRNKDLLNRFIFEKAPIRGEFVQLQESVLTILNQHDYPPSIRQLLGEALCVAVLLTAIIKFQGRLTVQFRGQGKLKLLLAQCDHHFHLRGLVKWDGEMSYSELMDAFNDGILVIMLDTGGIGRYQGIVSWRGNSLLESIEGFFKESEQLATKLWLCVGKESAAGFLLQVIPTKENATLSLQEDIDNADWKHIMELTEKLDPEEMLHLDAEKLLKKLYPAEEVRLFSPVPVMFKCTCTRKRGEDAILLLGQKEAEEELASKKSIVVTCDFCNEEYIFDKVDVSAIFKNKERPPPTNIH